MTDTPSRQPTNSAPVSSTLVAAPQQACPECHGTTGHTLDCTRVSKSQQKRYAAMAPQQEQAARFTVHIYGGILPVMVDTHSRHEWVCSPNDAAYARAIAAALNASPPKETT